MNRRARKPLSAMEVDRLTRLARGNALDQQRLVSKAEAVTPQLAGTPPYEADSRPLRILMISDVFFPRINGVSTSIASFRGALERQGHTVTLICPDYEPAQPGAASVLRITSRRVPCDPEDRMMRYRELMALAPQLATEAFDLIHVHTPFVAHWAGIALGRRLGIPIVSTYHTLFEEYLHHYVRWLPARWLRIAARLLTVRQCRRLDALVAPSRAMREALERYGVATPMAVIPTGLALEAFCHSDEANDFRRCHGLSAEARLLLFVGRVAHEKNIGFLIEMLPGVLARHPTTRLVVTGEGPAREKLARQAQEAGLGEAVIFLGYLDRNGSLQAAYRAADVFVFASRTETQGLVLLEALALGTPVVSTAVMGTREILEQGAGCLIAEEDHGDFAAKVNHVLDDPALQQELAHSGPPHAARWHEDTLATELAWVYGRCIEKGPATPPIDR